MLCLKEEGLNEKKYKTNKSSEITQIADVLHMFACPLRYWDRENKVLIDRQKKQICKMQLGWLKVYNNNGSVT